jgi:peptidoglycan hydrolase CwlO-like protein
MLHYKQEAEEVHSQLQQVYCQLQAEQQKSENLWAELAESKQELKQSQQNLERLQHQIAAMESSKFWQLRQEWFKLKRIFRVSAE